MGLLFSCCGKRQKEKKYQPLLDRDEQEQLGLSRDLLVKAAAAFGALSAGKLPTEGQLEHLLRTWLHSSILAERDPIGGKGPLSENGRKVLGDTRELIESILQFGMEKNYDDVFQELYFRYHQFNTGSTKLVSNSKVDLEVKSPSLNGDVIENILPQKEEVLADVDTAAKSVRTLASILLTSSAFRLILSNFFTASREMLADAVASLGHAAAAVEIQAKQTENLIRPDSERNVYSELEPSIAAREAAARAVYVGEQTQEHWEKLKEDPPDRVRDFFLTRWREVLLTAQKNPSYRASSLTLLSLIEKYYNRFHDAASIISESSVVDEGPSVVVSTQINVDPLYTESVSYLKTTLERLAGHHSLDPLIEKSESALKEIAKAPDQEKLRQWLRQVFVYLERSLDEEGFVGSELGADEAERLYDKGLAIIKDEANKLWVEELQQVAEEIETLIAATKEDKATQRLLTAAEVWLSDIQSAFRNAIGMKDQVQRDLQKEIRKDIYGWLLPRVLRLLRAVPMPRIEFASPTLDAVIDSVILSSASASLTPDHIKFQSLEELCLDLSEHKEEEDERSMETYLRTKLHLDGIRLNAYGISYYFKYKGPWRFIGYEDYGILDIDIGRPHVTGDGMKVDLEIDNESVLEEESLFRVITATFTIPGLRFRIAKSKHWILNSLMQPLLGPIVRQVLRWVLGQQIRNALTSLDKVLFDVHKVTNEKAYDPSLGDYWDALIHHFSTPTEEANEGDVDGESSEQSDPQTITETQTTMQGVIYKSTTVPDPEEANASPSETLVAIGAGEQILPGKGGPVLQEESMAEVATREARGAMDDVERGLQKGARKVDRARLEARKGVNALGEAQGRARTQHEAEARRKGWRSPAFNL